MIGEEVELYRLERPDVRATVTASIEKDGGLEVFAYDVGSFVEGMMGDSDYERATTVAAEHKDSLLLALLLDKFGENTHAYGDFGEFCRANEIPTSGWSWS